MPRVGQAARSLAQVSSSGWGSTRASATDVMKLESAFHRGRTWAWRCDGIPAPAASPRLKPTLTPCGLNAAFTATTASRIADHSSADSSSVRSSISATSR